MKARRVACTLALAGAVLGASAGGASAAPVQATCASLASQLSAASAGETIVLTGMCSGQSDTLPAVAGLTIEGASAGTNGFDGTGASGSALTGTSINGLTLSDLTFQNYTHGSAVSITDSSGTVNSPFVFDGDTFTGDGGATVPGGGLSLSLYPAACTFGSGTDVTVTSSKFTNDSAGGEGAGAYLYLDCPAAGAPTTAKVSQNAFADDHVTASAGQGDGGGLAIGTIGTQGVNRVAAPIELTQQSNTFTDDSVTGADSRLAGGGEITSGANLTSVDDAFTGNTLAGPTASGEWSWGAGLATFGGALCTNPDAVRSTLTNAIVAGNSIGAPVSPATGPDALGAGIYAGCLPTDPTSGYHLTLLDSTVSGNSVAGSPDGAVAGIDGETGDFLSLQNTIVAGDSGGAELGGFGATTAANVTATYSDVCSVSRPTAPFAGAGNICASPALAGAATGDVHETASSPTVDAGSNALVPSGLSTDAYGGPRIVAMLRTPATVDIGAAELALAPASTAAPAVAGTAAIGQTLQGSTGTWSYEPTSYAYQWQDCDSAGAGCVSIPNATGALYTVGSGDAGHTLRVIVTAANPGGSAQAASAATQAVPVPPSPSPSPSPRGPVCASALGRVHGATLGRVSLGMSAIRVRALYPKYRARAHTDVLCVTGGAIDAGYAYARLEARLGRRLRRALGSNVVWLATGNRHYSLEDVHPGMRLSRHRLPTGSGEPIGSHGVRWYVLRGHRVTALAGVRHGVVVAIAIASPSLTRTVGRLELLLAAFG